MAPTKSSEKKNLGNVLVIGGCGFLGHHIVDLIHTSYTASISVLDLRTVRNRRPDSDGVQYYDGDITNFSAILPIFEKVKPDVVIHTASPAAVSGPAGERGTNEMFYKVNVEGTRCIIEACQRSGVVALVYTSSASVISDNVSDLINADERWPVIPSKSQTEYYSQTKAEAEALVLAANRGSKLLTCSIRPAGIFGPGDVQQTPALINAYWTGKTGFQLGENTNLFDFTYVTNVAHSHILAARALLYTSTVSKLPAIHEKVDGEAFFITNGEPVYFWDYARMIWKAAGNEKGTEHVWKISKDIGLLIGGLLETVSWITGKPAALDKMKVRYSCMTRYYDITKAKNRLGYEPIVGLVEGVETSVAWFLADKAAKGEKKDQ